MKSIYQYADYRNYLRDYYEARKKEPGGYSFARYSRLLRLGSPNYSQLILEGKRALTIANAHHCADALELNADERAYLELLVIQELLAEPKHRRLVKERMKRFQIAKPKRAEKNLRAGEELKNWYSLAVLVYFAGKPEEASHADAARAIGISESEVASSLESFIARGFLKREKGYYSQVEQMLWIDRKAMNAIQKDYIRSQLDRSVRAFERGYDRGAKFGVHTFTVPAADAARYADRIEALIESLVTEADHPQNSELMQINFQVFPVR